MDREGKGVMSRRREEWTGEKGRGERRRVAGKGGVDVVLKGIE